MDNPISNLYARETPESAVATQQKLGVDQQNATTNSMSSLADYATKRAHLDIQKQQLQLQADQHQLIQNEFDARVGRQMGEDYIEASSLPDGPLKKARLKNWSDTYQKARQLTPENASEYVALANTPEVEPDMAKFKQFMTGKQVDDPEGFNRVWRDMRARFGNKPTMDMFKSAMDKEIAADAMAQRVGAGIESRQTMTAQRQYDTQNKPIDAALSANLRIRDLIKEGTDKDGKLKLTKQLKNTLGAEMSKIEVGAQTAEGDRERAMYSNLESELKGKFNFLFGTQDSVVDADMVKQMLGQSDTMAQSYMSQHDRLAETLLGGATGAEKAAVSGRANAYRKSMTGKGGYEKWLGPSAQSDSAPAQSAASAPPSQQASASLTPDAQNLKSKIDAIQDLNLKQAILNKLKPEVRKSLGY